MVQQKFHRVEVRMSRYIVQ